jgi:hypothetical protein
VKQIKHFILIINKREGWEGWREGGRNGGIFHKIFERAEDALERSFENSVGKKIFVESEDIWPHSHADLQKTVYSLPGIQKSVKEVLSGEFRSASSHIKVLCTCPDEVYKLLLEITRVGAQTKDKWQSVPIVNSTWNLVAFTL